MDHSAQIVAVTLGAVFTTGAVIAIMVTWLQSRPKMRMIEVLKAYAEKGEEPPATVLEAMGRLSWPFPPAPPPKKPTRGDHLAHMAGSVVLAIGASGVAWWRIAYGDPSSPWPMIAVLAAIFFYGAAAARLVGALTADDGGR